ncbi:MAG: hypothetical protein QXT73_03030 [Candidatus Methanomethylicaceae archaeon]
MNIRKMLESQEAIVVAAHIARLEALTKYGAFSEEYRAATRLYEDELQRYHNLELDVQKQRHNKEMRELGQAIGQYFSQLQARLNREFKEWGDQKVIDIMPERSESGDTLSKREYESLKKEQDYPKIVSEKRPMLPKPKK